MNYAKIEKYSTSNGNGIRVVLWESGCRLNCPGCHNPETHDFCYGKTFDETAFEELMNALDHPWISGITFSGGHPLEMENVYDTFDIICAIRERFPEKTIWLYTGYSIPAIAFFANPDITVGEKSIMYRVIQSCDVVVDGPYIEKERDISLAYRGSRNQRIIDVTATLATGNITILGDEFFGK